MAGPEIPVVIYILTGTENPLREKYYNTYCGIEKWFRIKKLN